MSESSTDVVVIDDDQAIRTLLATLLTGMGFHVTAASDGRSGIEEARRRAPVLVTVDMNLPGMDGVEVVRQLRSFSGAAIVVISGRDDELDMISALSSGADAYVTKPFRPRELRARIRALLRRPRETGAPVLPPQDLLPADPYGRPAAPPVAEPPPAARPVWGEDRADEWADARADERSRTWPAERSGTHPGDWRDASRAEPVAHEGRSSRAWSGEWTDDWADEPTYDARRDVSSEWPAPAGSAWQAEPAPLWRRDEVRDVEPGAAVDARAIEDDRYADPSPAAADALEPGTQAAPDHGAAAAPEHVGNDVLDDVADEAGVREPEPFWAAEAVAEPMSQPEPEPELELEPEFGPGPEPDLHPGPEPELDLEPAPEVGRPTSAEPTREAAPAPRHAAPDEPREEPVADVPVHGAHEAPEPTSAAAPTPVSAAEPAPVPVVEPVVEPAPAQPGEVLEMRGLRVEVGRSRAEVAGRSVALEPQELQVLVALLSGHRRVHTYPALARLLTHSDATPTDADRRLVEATVSALYGKLGDSPTAPRWIERLAGIGYRRTGV